MLRVFQSTRHTRRDLHVATIRCVYVVSIHPSQASPPAIHHNRFDPRAVTDLIFGVKSFQPTCPAGARRRAEHFKNTARLAKPKRRAAEYAFWRNTVMVEKAS